MLWCENNWQADAMLLPDWKWRMRNADFLIRAGTIAHEIEPLSVEYPYLKRLDTDFLTSGSLNILSKELSEFLLPLIDAEFIPIKGFHNGREYTSKKFFILHLKNRFSAIDRIKSDYTEWDESIGGGIHLIKKIILDETQINDSSAFVLEETGFSLLRNDICRKITDAGFKGLRFFPIEDYKSI